MKKKLLLGIGGIASIVLPTSIVVACNNDTTDGDKKADDNKNKRKDFLSAAAYISASAEYDAANQTTYKAAEKIFDELSTNQKTVFDTAKVDKANSFAVTNPTSGKAIPVVFMDIDETVLNNIGYQAYNITHDTAFNINTWNEWIKAEQAIKIVGAINFIKHVWNNGGVVMFNSDRDQALWSHTKANLTKAGLDANMVKDWVSWEQGIDPANAKPWSVSNHAHTKKEERMDAMNQKTTGYDLSEYYTGGKSGAVVLKTVMRVGDNLNDFNDLAYKGKLNSDRKRILNSKILENMGSTDSFGKVYNTATKVLDNEAWKEAYIQVGSNAAYGGWEEGLLKGYYGKTPDEQHKARIDSLIVWQK